MFKILVGLAAVFLSNALAIDFMEDMCNKIRRGAPLTFTDGLKIANADMVCRDVRTCPMLAALSAGNIPLVDAMLERLRAARNGKTDCWQDLSLGKTSLIHHLGCKGNANKRGLWRMLTVCGPDGKFADGKSSRDYFKACRKPKLVKFVDDYVKIKAKAAGRKK